MKTPTERRSGRTARNLFVAFMLCTAMSAGAVDGDLDSAFSADGVAWADWTRAATGSARAAVAGDGRMVLASTVVDDTNRDFGAARFTRDGALDATFGFFGLRTIGIEVLDVLRYFSADGVAELTDLERAAITAKLEAATAAYNRPDFDATDWLTDAWQAGRFDAVLLLADDDPGCGFEDTTLRLAGTEPPLDPAADARRQTIALPSWPAVTIVSPSGENSAAHTHQLWPRSTCSVLPVARFQSRAV